MQISQVSLYLLCLSSANAFAPRHADAAAGHVNKQHQHPRHNLMRLSMFLQSPPPAVTAAATATATIVNDITAAAAAAPTNTNTNTNTNFLMNGIQNFLLPPPAFAADTVNVNVKLNMNNKPPTNDEIKLLREALGALYGERNPEKALELLTKAIAVWERQPPDEKAALFRVRGDCYMELRNAEAANQDYTTTIQLLTGPGGNLADPEELPAAYLGRARSTMASSPETKLSKGTQASEDYQLAMRLTSREEWDTNSELEADGAQRNPYAAWEWGMALRASANGSGSGTGQGQGQLQLQEAAEKHILASEAFKEIGDRARSTISKLDAGIDLAGIVDSSSSSSNSNSNSNSNSKFDETVKLLKEGIKSTTLVEGRDVELLQRVIAKEGEARIALASLLWSHGDKAAAEAELGEACGRLDQLQADADVREKARIKSGAMPAVKVQKLKYTIDDTAGVESSFSRFKSEKFLDSLSWPKSLQEKVTKLSKLA